MTAICSTQHPPYNTGYPAGAPPPYYASQPPPHGPSTVVVQNKPSGGESCLAAWYVDFLVGLGILGDLPIRNNPCLHTVWQRCAVASAWTWCFKVVLCTERCGK